MKNVIILEGISVLKFEFYCYININNNTTYNFINNVNTIFNESIELFGSNNEDYLITIHHNTYLKNIL